MNTTNTALAHLLYNELRKIALRTEPVGGTAALYRLLQVLFFEITKAERLQFSTLFARIAYVAHQHQLDRALQFYIHLFRKGSERTFKTGQEEEKIYLLGLKVVAECIAFLLQMPIIEELKSHIPENWQYPYQPPEVRAYKAKVRAVAVRDDAQRKQLIAKAEDEPETVIRVQYNITGYNDNFDAAIAGIRRVFGFPVTLNLLDVEIDKAGVYRPRAFVVEPDYLVDVSAVAECFREGRVEPSLHLMKKFLPFEVSKHLALGNIANFFLDELMHRPDASFQELFPKVFQINPLAFCLFENGQLREIQQESQKHYTTLKKLVKEELTEQQIEIQQCFLEPTFYSEMYGLQGRLDVFYQSEERAAIVELKSGKPFQTNAYGISPNHFVQTLLYDLLIQSTFGKDTDPANYILYSGQQESPLRFAPRVRAQQYEALQVRNHLVAMEWLLLQIGQKGDLLEQGERLFGRLRPSSFPYLKGFALKDLTEFEKVWTSLPVVEKKYLTAFTGFIAREHQLAKTGVQGLDSVNGQASLWLDWFERKQEQFCIINHLKLLNNQANDDEPLLIFNRTALTNPLANFRQGDIAVLYPQGDSPLAQQIFKCTIVELNPETVTIRLRSRQFNASIFERFAFWNLEPDLLDSSFLAMYRGLYEFAKSDSFKKNLLLGTCSPKKGGEFNLKKDIELTEEQYKILCQILAAPDYFLLWGPPGTGKTGVMLKHIVQHLLHETQENILLLAYTNRAVDEMCESIEQIGGDIQQQYLRIGSHYATDERFHEQLLQTKTAGIATRKDLKQIIESHRIIVATVSSIGTKPELFALKKFDTVIIDEASQILEPMLAGLLPQFKRFILIGDHKQLPAVVTQDAETSAVRDADLQCLGLTNLRNSLFERLYKRCQQQGWHWAYAQLSHQGRMHRDLMEFPNVHFYQNTLKILPETTPAHFKQLQPITFQVNGNATKLECLLCKQRVVFIPTPIDHQSITTKTNRAEAELVAELMEAFQKLQNAGYQMPDARRDTLTAGSTQLPNSQTFKLPNHKLLNIGIITPYRAQIAQIRSVLLEKKKIDITNLTIDTVERYQGGARDIIIISLCTNSLYQIEALASRSDEGIDRKLNVALTRAREHVVILGCPDLLRESAVYRALMESVGVELV